MAHRNSGIVDSTSRLRQRLADAVHLEPDLTQPRMIQKAAPVENPCGFHHRLENRLKVEGAELIPLCEHEQRVRIRRRLAGAAGKLDPRIVRPDAEILADLIL